MYCLTNYEAIEPRDKRPREALTALREYAEGKRSVDGLEALWQRACMAERAMWNTCYGKSHSRIAQLRRPAGVYAVNALLHAFNGEINTVWYGAGMSATNIAEARFRETHVEGVDFVDPKSGVIPTPEIEAVRVTAGQELEKVGGPTVIEHMARQRKALADYWAAQSLKKAKKAAKKN